MATKAGELAFEASARLQRLLGRELLTDDYSAIEELVKNAYDSNATVVSISISRPAGRYRGEIVIRDNGEGMALDEFERKWMWAGYSEKTGRPSPRTGRVAVGEKGIGRFAADKLGDTLTVVTKKANSSQALRVDIDWRRFANKKKRLSDVRIPYQQAQDTDFGRNGSGTILRIGNLRSDWGPKSVEELRKRLSRLLNPYDKDQEFRIVLEAPERKLSGELVPSEIVDHDFEWEVVKESNGAFTVRRRTRITSEQGALLTKWETQEERKQSDFGQSDFGPVNARFFYFVEKPKKSQVGDNLPGVAVFRDGLKVEPAGSSYADWLGLLEKRAKRAGHMPLVPSRLFGFIEIHRNENPQLQDATNRRAFVAGPSFDAFTNFLKGRLRDFESQVEEEVAKPRWERSRQAKSRKLILARYQTLSFLSMGLAHELRQPLQTIHAAADNVVGHLRKAGINIPEVTDAMEAIQRGVERIDRHIRFLREIGAGKDEAERFNLAELVGSILEAFKEQAAARKISLNNNVDKSLVVHFNRNLILTTVTNLVVNAIQAIEERGDRGTFQVQVEVRTDTVGIRLRVVDDGPGIPESVRRRLFKRQTTDKQGGMGVALIIWRDALQMLGGDLSCVSYANPTTFEVFIPSGGGNGQNSPS